ncbi:MAG TPA: hypothetical protein VI794_02030 [Patescibacteria group bacterium]|nr:hypothetical protein [Patescibacteria group bacterium]
MEERYDHKLPFDIDMLVPRFPYRPHSSWVQLVFAIIVGSILGGILVTAYFLLF